MANGTPWTRLEIDALVEIVEAGGDTVALSASLERTHEAVLAKANRLRLRPSVPQLAADAAHPGSISPPRAYAQLLGA